MTDSEHETTLEKIPVGVSSCLLGEEVRFDGGHKRSHYIRDVLGAYFELRPFCPEVAAGMGVPRAPVRLVQVGGGTRVRGVKDASKDFTEALDATIGEIEAGLPELRGYILKKGSPSCGMERVPVYTEAGMPHERNGVGRFARALRGREPLLPVEEEGRLNDAGLRENFICRVFVYDRWKRFLAAEPGVQGLIEFHTRHKYLLMAHDQDAYRAIGRLLADAGRRDFDALCAEYIRRLMTALSKPASRRGQSNVIQHLMGYLKQDLSAEEKAELLETLDRYRDGYLPLIVPMTLLKHHFRMHPKDYVAGQYFMEPHPFELMLRNHV